MVAYCVSLKMSRKQVQRELETLRNFIDVYCRKKHSTGKGDFCDDCQDLLEYATERLERCPMVPKPKCKACTVHCYKDEYRKRIREVMKFSGIYYVKRGRLDWLIKYFLQK